MGTEQGVEAARDTAVESGDGAGESAGNVADMNIERTGEAYEWASMQGEKPMNGRNKCSPISRRQRTAMRFSFSVILALCLAFAVSACARLEPVHNVIEAPVVTGSNIALTANQVKNAIITACVEVDVDDRWFVDPKIDGQIIAWGEVNGRTTVIDIFYSPTRYSIKYKDSDGLLNDGQQIDRHYNQRIQKLAGRIDLVLNKL